MATHGKMQINFSVEENIAVGEDLPGPFVEKQDTGLPWSAVSTGDDMVSVSSTNISMDHIVMLKALTDHFEAGREYTLSIPTGKR